jgi:hypothetical protein
VLAAAGWDNCSSMRPRNGGGGMVVGIAIIVSIFGGSIQYGTAQVHNILNTNTPQKSSESHHIPPTTT